MIITSFLSLMYEHHLRENQVNSSKLVLCNSPSNISPIQFVISSKHDYDGFLTTDFFSRKKVMMYLIDHNIIRLFSLLLFCPCSSLEVYFWPWWKLALSIFKQTQKDNEWQKQVVLLLHDGTDDMFFSKATIHNPLFYIQSLSRLSILFCCCVTWASSSALTFNNKLFLKFFFNQDETLVFSDCALLRIWLKFKVALTLYDTTWWEKLRKFPDFHYHFSFLYVFEGFILCCCFCLSFKSLRHAWNKSRKKFSFRSAFFQNWVVL